MSSRQPEQAASAGTPGDVEWNRLLEEQLGDLRGYTRRLVRDRDEAEDLLQDVIERALRYRSSFDPGSPAGPWLRRIALRAFIDRRAQRARDPVRLGEGAGAIAARRAADPHESEAEVQRLLAPLGELEREIVLRFHARGEHLTDIARELGMPLGTCKSSLHRARRKLVRGGRPA